MDRPVAEVGAYTTHNKHNRQHINAPDGIRTRNSRKREAAYLRLGPRGHRHQLNILISKINMNYNKKQMYIVTNTTIYFVV